MKDWNRLHFTGDEITKSFDQLIVQVKTKILEII